MSARSTIYATFSNSLLISLFWNKECCTFLSPKQSCILLLRHRCDAILSGSFLLCIRNPCLALLSLLSLKQCLCDTRLFTRLGQLYLEMSSLHTFVQFACCSCYLYHFKTIWQQNSKAVMQKQNSKAIMQKATNSTDSKMQRNPKRKRNMFFFTRVKFNQGVHTWGSKKSMKAGWESGIGGTNI